MTFYTYMVLCDDSTIYTGQTNDIERRLDEHSSGAGARYTKHHGVIGLIYVAEFETRSEAMREEKRIKSLSREQKLEMAFSNA